jgi:hypothetical protein
MGFLADNGLEGLPCIGVDLIRSQFTTALWEGAHMPGTTPQGLPVFR